MARQRCGRLVSSPAPDCPNSISVDPVPVDFTVLGRKRLEGMGGADQRLAGVEEKPHRERGAGRSNCGKVRL